MSIRPFTVDVDDATRAELGARLRLTHLLANGPDLGWNSGTDRTTMREMIA
jgi:hypothetical protein